MTQILNAYGQPIKSTIPTPKASRDSGSFRGTSFEYWNGPQTHSKSQEARERTITQRRAADLYANDWAAHAAVEAISSNAVGVGINPIANVPAKLLNISDEQALEINEQLEWAFSLWSEEADIRGMLDFYDLQLLGMQQILSLGEMIHLPVMLSEKDRKKNNFTFSMHLQNISPARLISPLEHQQDSYVIDGIKIDSTGKPETYFFLTPKDVNTDTTTGNYAHYLSDFTQIPANIGHRKNVLHLFKHETDEQYRGHSIFSKSMGLFRNLGEVISYELIAQVMAACFPVFVSLENSSAMPQNVHEEVGDREEAQRSYIQEMSEGRVYYGTEGEKPYVLESKRPSANFSAFVNIVTRAISASVGIPMESLTKDFSNTNYSSARAALNEAWKLYSWYRKWFSRRYCQQVWNLLIEEAFLRGMIKLPKNAPSFYEARRYYCNVDWVGPSRGHIDPVKEVNAIVLKLQNNLMTYREAYAELGSDFSSAYTQLLDEKEKIATLNKVITNE